MSKSNLLITEDVQQYSLKNFIKRIREHRMTGLVVLLLIILTVMSIVRTDTFFTTENLFNILKQVSIVSIIAIGQTFIMVSGGIDLSVGYSLGLSGVIMAFAVKAGIPTPLALAAGMAAGTLVGLCNGLIITRFKLPPFIVTLGMAKIARGVMYVITRGYPIPVRDKFVIVLGNAYWGPVPVLTLIMLILIISGSFLLSNTVFGNKTKAIGGNELAACLSGIKIDIHKIKIYAMTGVLCGIAGIILAGRVNSGNPNSGVNFELDSIAAAIVGGTAMSGGEGMIIGTLLGALILGVIRNALVLLNISMYWQTIVAGVIIITVCALDKISHQKSSN